MLSTGQEEPSRSYKGERPTLVSTLTDRRMDAAIGNQNKVKYMATQLLAKFEENAPAQSTGVRRQVSPKPSSRIATQYRKEGLRACRRPQTRGPGLCLSESYIFIAAVASPQVQGICDQNQ